MESNIKTAQHLEENLLQHFGSGITELREFANLFGCDLSIQANGLWVSRPGYSKAIQLNMPISPMEWRMGVLQDHIRICADILWEKNDRKPTLQ